MQPEPATSKDLAPIQALLAAASLPWEDLSQAHLEHFLVIRNGAGELLAAGGIEPCGKQALLRSIVVSPAERGRGLAGQLVQLLEQDAARLGARQLYLLTTSAAGYFARLGYRTTGRDSAPESIQRTREFQDICPSSATCMLKDLPAV